MADEQSSKGSADQERHGAATATQGRIKVGQAADVPERGKLVVDIDEHLTIGVFRVEGLLYAYQNVCAHQGGPVCQGQIMPGVRHVFGETKEFLGQKWDESDMHIVCPWHGYEYSIKTGRHAGNPSVHLKAFKVDEANGEIHVEL